MGALRLMTGLLLAVTGCSATVGGPTSDEGEAVVQVAGKVAVVRAVSHLTGVPSPRTHVSASFVRVTGSIDLRTAERVVGSSLPFAAGPERGCAWLDPPTELVAPPAAGASIELLDAGEVLLRADGGALPLAQRAFPDVGDIVSGVVYTSRDDRTDLPTAGTLLIETTGSARVAGFRVEVEAPEPLAGVRVADQPIEAGEIAAEAGERLVLGWQPGDVGAGDRVFVDLTAPQGNLAGRTLRCGFDDTGNGQVAAEQLGAWSAGVELELTVHRHRRATGEPADGQTSDGAVRAVVDFDFAVTARLSVEP
jgi:hypothetical protein